MRRTIRTCAQPGCPEDTHATYCPDHTRDTRSPSSRVTGRRDWRERIKPRILEEQGYCCYWCGGVADTVDHRTPVVAGGTNDPSNLVASCTPCNRSKNSHPTPWGREVNAPQPDAARPAQKDAYATTGGR